MRAFAIEAPIPRDEPVTTASLLRNLGMSQNHLNHEATKITKRSAHFERRFVVFVHRG